MVTSGLAPTRSAQTDGITSFGKPRRARLKGSLEMRPRLMCPEADLRYPAERKCPAGLLIEERVYFFRLIQSSCGRPVSKLD